MLTVAYVLLGALGAAAFVLAARRLARRRELPIYAAGLVVAALVYVVFAVAGGASAAWLAAEFAGLAAFSLVALPRLRSRTLPLALAWAAHALWDILLHADAHFAPDWYRLVCAGFDLALAAYLLSPSRRAAADADAR